MPPRFTWPNLFAEHLDCDIHENGRIITDELGRASQRNIYAAGEGAQLAPSSLMISAAEGNKAAGAVNMDITDERF